MGCCLLRSKIALAVMVSIALAVIFVCSFFNHYQGEKYKIIHAVYLPSENPDVLAAPGKLFYSNEKLLADAQELALFQKAGMKSSELEGPDLILAVIPNYTIKTVVGRQDFGFILIDKNTTNGVSLTIFKGTKRFLQFSDAAAQMK